MSTRIAWKPYLFNQALPHLIKTVTVPTLVVWGKQTRMVPLSCGERYQQAMPKAKLEVIDGAGHYLEVEKPAELARLTSPSSAASRSIACTSVPSHHNLGGDIGGGRDETDRG